MFTFLLFLFFSPIVVFLISLIPFQIIKKFQKPKLHRNWDSLHQKLSEIIFDKNNQNIIYIKNIRDAKYNPNFEFENRVEYLNKKYNLEKLSKLWILVNPYNFLESHVVLSFQFSDDFIHNSFLTLSYEIRKTDPIDFKIFKTFYKAYEGYYLLATEEDTFFVRTNVRKHEKLFLYPLNMEPDKIKNIFLEFAKHINTQNHKAEFYKILSGNCLSKIFSVLAKLKILKIHFYNYFMINNFIYKSGLVNNSKDLNYKTFLQKYKIENTNNLLPDENYSFQLRKQNLK